MWGVHDKRTREEYGSNILKVPNIVERMLDLFSTYKIHGTWATVGFLFLEGKQEFITRIPQNAPKYLDSKLSPYNYFYKHELAIGDTQRADALHWGRDTLNLIKLVPNQEIASHTFSHYYCLEPGQSLSEFEEDIETALLVAKSRGVILNSIVFPRNQVNPEYLKICLKHGIRLYRGTEQNGLWSARNNESLTLGTRILRYVDAYLSISGSNTYLLETNKDIVNVPSSAFLRPYNSKLALLERLKIRRIKNSMKNAAIKGECYHLWWHPHNFGSYTDENFNNLEKILKYYKYLQEMYGFRSSTMSETLDSEQ